MITVNDHKGHANGRPSPIIIAVLGYIPHPRQGLIPALLHNLQVADLDTGYREVGNLKLDADGCALLRVLFCRVRQSMAQRWVRHTDRFLRLEDQSEHASGIPGRRQVA